ncbi:hypothetical protein BAVI_12284 [Neobacillus vireti LMG 21834]|uniref:Uncharacterized protein n=1 Tax=Neobacillus vireti LMG 21834 TaxID=1131730 RepID=A0AB94INC5_9BACI|nr:hypothetical protein [Neobacillus vireti]ETI68468.1 hypothetical protein BAVI_12284 [Neobacillus vireti LMG 21834]
MVKTLQGPEDLQATVNFVKSINGPIHYEAEGRISEDTQAPEIADAKLPAADFRDGSYLHDVTIALEATDPGIGVSRIEYSLDNGVTWNRYDKGLTVNKAGKNSIQYRAIDKVHNVSATKTIKVLITSATIENTVALVKQAKGNNGIKTSLIAQLENVIKTFEKGQENKAYQSLEKLYLRISQLPDKHLEEVDKKEIMFMLQYIIEHRTAISGDEFPALKAS